VTDFLIGMTIMFAFILGLVLTTPIVIYRVLQLARDSPRRREAPVEAPPPPPALAPVATTTTARWSGFREYSFPNWPGYVLAVIAVAVVAYLLFTQEISFSPDAKKEGAALKFEPLTWFNESWQLVTSASVLNIILVVVALAGILALFLGKVPVAGFVLAMIVLVVLAWPTLQQRFHTLGGSSTTLSTGTCDHRFRTVKVRSEPVEINPSGRCAVTFLVLKGGLKFIGPSVPVGAQYLGNQLNSAVSGIITHAVATSGEAELQYQLCHPNHKSSNWCS